MSIRIGILGGRGHVGAELIRLIGAHPEFELAFVSSRERAGDPLAAHGLGSEGELVYINPSADEAAGYGADALVLALPNGHSREYVAAVDARAAETILLDLSADHRFDPAWHYGLPELTRAESEGKRRISNPGCYATAMQLAIAPMCDALTGPVQCFGISGYSGAGTTPSDRNDPKKLQDNLMPYALVDHIHQREVEAQMGHVIEFMPAVAAHFRGITMTVNVHLSRDFSVERVRETYARHYSDEILVNVIDEVPWVSRIVGRSGAELGGFAVTSDHRRLVLVATLDNLLKGAATQAIQNLNLAFGLPETTGIVV